MEIDIKKFLNSYRGRQLKYVPNRGNAGDSMIAMGTLQELDEAGLNYSLETLGGTFNNDLIFLGGGGNLVGPYGELRNFLRKNEHNNEIVILPHTIKSEDEVISSLGDNVKIICRERKSHEYVSSLARYPKNIFLSRDMAFYIRAPDGLSECGAGVLNAFRTNTEQTKIHIPGGNRDISLEFKLPNGVHITTPEGIAQATEKMFSCVSKFETINTNRLHVGIAGCLLNKRVNLYPNSYWKVEEVYKYSIKGKYPKVNFTNKHEGKVEEYKL